MLMNPKFNQIGQFKVNIKEILNCASMTSDVFASSSPLVQNMSTVNKFENSPFDLNILKCQSTKF